MPHQGLLSRVALSAFVLCCCGVIAMSMLFVASFFAHLPNVQQQIQAQQQQLQQQLHHPAPVVAIDQRGNGPRHHAQRSVIHRLAMLKRAQPPARGVDEATVAMAFPHWVNSDASWDTRAVLGDIVLALSYLAQEEDE